MNERISRYLKWLLDTSEIPGADRQEFEECGELVHRKISDSVIAAQDWCPNLFTVVPTEAVVEASSAAFSEDPVNAFVPQVPLGVHTLPEEVTARVREIVKEYANTLKELAPEAAEQSPRSLASTVLSSLANGAANRSNYWQVVEQIVVRKFYARLMTSLDASSDSIQTNLEHYPQEAVIEDIQEIRDTLCRELPEALDVDAEIVHSVVDAAFTTDSREKALAKLRAESVSELPPQLLDSLVDEIPKIFQLR